MFAITRAVASPALRHAVTSVAFQRFAVAAAVNVLAPKLIHATRVAHLVSATRPAEEFVRLPVSVAFHKDDEKELRMLLMKLHMQANLFDTFGYKRQMAEDRKDLAEIPGLELSEEQVEALLEWKHLDL